MRQNYKSNTINVTATVEGAKTYDDIPDTISISIDGFTHVLNKIKTADSTTKD